MVLNGTGSWTFILDSIEGGITGHPEFKLVIYCDTTEFRIFLDDIEKKSFPYLTPLEKLTGVFCVQSRRKLSLTPEP